ncbi:MAG: hypothetical protein ACRD6Q_01050 [Nitrososphaeraceae archaeon]
MSDKKVGIFSALLFFGVAALFLPATALQNSIAMAQEYYPEYEENEYYYNQEYDPYKNDNDNDKYKNGPIVNVEKKLFICNNVTGSLDNFFACVGQRDAEFPDFFFFPPALDSGEYIPCNDEICPVIDESDFSAQIFKDVATVRDLTPDGTPVNLDKFHYSVTEEQISDIISPGGTCEAVGFTHSLFYEKVRDDRDVNYFICVNYVGDCEGTIYPGEEKTCTIENYIVEGNVFPLLPSDNTAGSVQSSLQQKFTNQATPSLSNILGDRIPGLAH